MSGAVLLVGGGAEAEAIVAEAAARLGLRLRVEGGLGDGLRAVGEQRWAAVLLSLELAGADLELAARVAREPGVGALVLLARDPSAEEALRAVGAGAAEVLAMPVSVEAVERALRGARPTGARVSLPQQGTDRELVGSSPALVEVFKTVGRVGPSPASVLITGESGTGKELVARAIHRTSARAGGPFMAVNCAAIPEDLLESELFGHERGAFTGAVSRKVGRFERANGGTLFLDEIGDMSLVLQAKILRALQERTIERLGGEEAIALDVRVVSATHRDLPALIAAGEFREDLFYRLAVVRLHLPPLRERPRDVRELALHYAARFAAEYGRPVRWVAEGALARLEGHRWPGNVRELRNVVERATLVATGDTLAEEDISLDAASATEPAGAALPGYAPTLSMAEVERLHIREVLREVGGQLGRAAEVLGVHRNTVSRKVQEFGLGEGT